MKSKFIKNLSGVLIAKMIQMVIQLVIGMLMARYLGPTKYGVINYVASYITFFTAFVQMGLQGVIVKQLIDKREIENTVLGTAIFMRLVLGVISSIAVVFLVFIMNQGETELLIVAVLEAIALLFAGFDSINYWYQSHQKLRYSAFIQLLAYIVVAVYKVVLMITGAGVLPFAFSSSLDVICVAIFYFTTYKKNGGLKLQFNWSIGKELIKQSYPFLVAGIMIIVYQQMDKIMLGKMLDTTTVGYYSAVTTICNLWSIVPTALLDTMRPMVMKEKGRNENKYRIRLIETFSGLIYLTVAFSTGVSLFAKLVIWILYGEEYLVAVPTLRIAVWYTCFSYIGSGRSIYLICEGKNKYAQVFCTWGAVINFVLNYLLIPKFGINGAAFATLVTHTCSDFLIPAIYPATREYCKFVIKGIWGWKYILEDLKLIKDRRRV